MKKANNENTKEVEFSVPLKDLSNFQRTLVMPLINCEVSLTLTWSKNCVITDEIKQDANLNTSPPVLEIRSPEGTIFEKEETKLYVPELTLSTQDDNKLPNQLETGFKRTIKWNNYMSELTNQDKNDNLNYLTDRTFSKVNRLFVLSFENENDRASFKKYCMPNIKVKDFNVLIDGKSFFDVF